MQVCKALCGLHQRDIVHGDLRPANVMWFSSSFSMKLVDFARWSDKGLPTPLAINLRYAAPEVRISPHLLLHMKMLSWQGADACIVYGRRVLYASCVAADWHKSAACG